MTKSIPWLSELLRLLRFAMPLLLTVVVYDSQRYWGPLLRGEIHVREPYLFDLTLFGISTAQGHLTPNEWFQLHTYPVLDFFSGFAYLTFVLIFLLQAGYFAFAHSEKGSVLGIDMMWAFLWVNLMGYATYYFYPAAPPWYAALYGFDSPQPGTLPSPAGCVRFEQLTGIHLFSKMYSQSANVFGAIPSLHVAYPLIAFCYSVQLKSMRVFSLLFYLLMCFSAVYLNHHYILDLMIGSLYALIVVYFMSLYRRPET